MAKSDQRGPAGREVGYRVDVRMLNLNQAEIQVDDQIEDQVWGQVYDRVWGQLWWGRFQDQIGFPLGQLLEEFGETHG